MAMVFFLSYSAASAFAGAKERHMWQGAAIALGAAIVGNAILDNCQNVSSLQHTTVVHNIPVRPAARPHYGSCPPPAYQQGHWENQNVWVEPVCERVWNPGHYNDYSQWVPGQYILIERQAGYWKTARVWVPYCR